MCLRRSDGTLVDPDFLRRNVLYPAMDKAGIDRGLRTHGFHIFRHTGGSVEPRAIVDDFGRLRSHE